jgi:chaperonin GroEL (HSP60 family)
MKVEGKNLNPINIQQKIKSAEKEALKEIKQDGDSASISKTARDLYNLQSHPEVRIEKIKIAKQLIEEDQEISREKVRIGIKKMLLGMFSQRMP